MELRSRDAKYRGEVLIISGVGIWRGTDFPIGPRGVTLCVVNLIDSRPALPSDEAAAGLFPPPEYGWAWVLSEPRAVRQLPIKGKLGLYGASAELIASIA